MKYDRLLWICFAILLTACNILISTLPDSTPLNPQSPPFHLPSVTPSGEPTAALSPSAVGLPDMKVSENLPEGPEAWTPTSYPTLTSTPMPYPDLHTGGPFLIYDPTLDGHGPLVLLDADASGRRLLHLPEDGHIHDLRKAPSPDGHWLAFFTGSIDTLDLTLRLLNVTDGSVRTISALLPPDYPDNFEAAAAALTRQDPQGFYTSEGLRGTFENGIHSLEWSPNGRYLAFTNGMDGPSSDLYLYDLQTGLSNRLTSGPAEIQWMDWSPDNQWIVHASAYDRGAGCNEMLFVAKFDGSEVKDLDDCGYGGVWSSNSVYTLHSSDNGPGDHHLRNIDVVQNTTSNIWPDDFQGLAFDPKTGIMAVSSSMFYHNYPVSSGPPVHEYDNGLYLVYADGSFKQVSNQTFDIYYRNGSRHRFIIKELYSSSNGLYGMTEHGSLTQIEEESGQVEISPNYEWMLIIDDKSINLYGPADRLLRTIQISISPVDIRPIIWRPDSAGFFYVSKGSLYYLSLPDGQPLPVDKGLLKVEPWWETNIYFGWLMSR